MVLGPPSVEAIRVLEQKRDQTLRLHVLESQLRSAVSDKMRKTQETLANVAVKIGVGHGEVHLFLNSQGAISSDRMITALCLYADSVDLHEPIMKAAKGLNDPQIGISALPEAVIRLVYDMHAAQKRHAEQLTREDFSRAFPSHQALITACFNFHRDGINALKEQTLFEEIRLLLDSPSALHERLAPAIEAAAATHAAAHQEFLELWRMVRPLFPKSTERKEIARQLNCGTTSLASAIAGTASLGALKSAIEHMRTYLESRTTLRTSVPTSTAVPTEYKSTIPDTMVTTPAPTSTPSQQPSPAPSPLPPSISPPPMREEQKEKAKEEMDPKDSTGAEVQHKRAKAPSTFTDLDEVGGVVSSFGIPYTLPHPLPQIDEVPGKFMIMMLVQVLRFARAIANYFCSIKDERFHESVVNTIMAEITETKFSLEALSLINPSKYTHVINAGRASAFRGDEKRHTTQGGR